MCVWVLLLLDSWGEAANNHGGCESWERCEVNAGHQGMGRRFSGAASRSIEECWHPPLAFLAREIRHWRLVGPRVKIWRGWEFRRTGCSSRWDPHKKMGVGARSNPGLNPSGCYRARINFRIIEVRQCHSSFWQWNRWFGVVLFLRGLHWHFLQLKFSHWLSRFPCPPLMKEFGWEWASAISIFPTGKFGSADSIQSLGESLLQLQGRSWPGSTKEGRLPRTGLEGGPTWQPRGMAQRFMANLADTKWLWKPKEGNCTKINLG